MTLPARLARELDQLGLSAAHRPPSEVAKAAARGLELRALYGRGGTEVGLARARALAARTPVTTADLRVIAAWFARFSYLRERGAWDDESNPSTGYIAWMLWGGDVGREWVCACLSQHDSGEPAAESPPPPAR